MAEQGWDYPSIELESEEGKGSAFTFYLPLDKPARIAMKDVTQGQHISESAPEINKLLGRLTQERIENRSSISELLNEIGDDRNAIQPKDKLVIVFDGDQEFGKTVLDVARTKGLKGVIATNYLEIFDVANRMAPVAIIMEIKPKDPSSWKAMNLLRSELAYRHIPIYIISSEENRSQALRRGAKTFVTRQGGGKSLDLLCDDINAFYNKQTRKVLVVGENAQYVSELERACQDHALEVEVVKNGKKATDQVLKTSFDCIVLDYDVEDISGDELVREIARSKARFTPVIVHSARTLSEPEHENIKFNANFFVPRHASWVEHLLDATLSYINIDHRNLHPDYRGIIEKIHNNEDILIGKTVLVVDDDVRNLFTLTSVLERYKINVVTAESGQEAISILHSNSNVEMVLMDIMMPEMDGYETTRRIRLEDRNSLLPIIAVTAKAMKGDRQKCIEAGASDYIVKPVKIDQLLSLIRLWFNK